MEPEKAVVQMTWHEIGRVAFEVLNYQLFELDGYGVSLGKLITGILMLVLGYYLAGRGSKEVDRRVLTRLNVDESLRYTLKRFIFYFLLSLSTLFTLHTLHVPVTIFTVLGGALAVGIGFGSQNLVNNFISGILVMLERPIRVRDYIEIEGISGQVESIGIRSTIVRTGTNAVTVMPNTTFIEKNLTNWTMSGTITATVRVGVGYSTDVKTLTVQCVAALKELPAIISTPGPSVRFADFGDNALIFDVVYQIESSSFPDRKLIESAVRFRLHDLFLEHKIDLPFPQREVHLRLDPAAPVQIRT